MRVAGLRAARARKLAFWIVPCRDCIPRLKESLLSLLFGVEGLTGALESVDNTCPGDFRDGDGSPPLLFTKKSASSSVAPGCPWRLEKRVGCLLDAGALGSTPCISIVLLLVKFFFDSPPSTRDHGSSAHELSLNAVLICNPTSCGSAKGPLFVLLLDVALPLASTAIRITCSSISGYDATSTSATGTRLVLVVEFPFLKIGKIKVQCNN